MTDTPLLQTRSLTKSFGALHAVQNVTLDFMPGEVHAIIGPNGAGKTTLINLLSGDLAATSGEISFKGVDITRRRVDQISQMGIGRSYQKTNLFPEFTCLENCWLGAQSRLPSSLRFFRNAIRYDEVYERAQKALELCGLGARINIAASSISHGEQRQLEIGMMLATEPDLLLLDEPLAGMGANEAAQIIKLLKKLAEDHTIILIEHDMDAVFAIADILTVMLNGRVLDSGRPQDIRASAIVQEAYLGSPEVGSPEEGSPEVAPEEVS